MASQQDVQAKLDALRADVESETDVVSAIEVLLTGMDAQLADLRQQLADAIANGNDPAALDALIAQIDAITATNASNRDRIVAAVVARTPSAPEPTA